MQLERQLLMKRGDDVSEVVAAVGEPVEKNRTWYVPVHAPWFCPEATEIAGADAIHAMRLAIEFLERALTSTTERQFFYPPEDDEPPEPYQPYASGT